MDTERFMEKMKAYGADTAGVMERFVGDVELYRDCLTLFLEDKSFMALEQGLAQKDTKRAFEAAHTLKGVAGNLGLTPLFQAICCIVEPLRQGSEEDLTPQYEAIMRETARLKQTMVQAV